MPTIAELRSRWREVAVRHAISPRDVDVLLSDAAGRPFSWILAHDEEEAPLDLVHAIEEAVRRRLAHEPLQYIRGHTEFFGRRFEVDDRVLIPRPETELLVDQCIRRIPGGAWVVDVGTGSGCIAATLAIERADLHLVATDRSVAALALARRNATRLGARVAFVASDVMSAIGRARLGAVVSNPPYVPANEVPGLQAEVREWEPESALTPGETGLEIIERIYEDAARRLDREGLVLLEIGYGQGETVVALAARHGWRTELRDDLAGIPRIAISSRA